jgi:hypothetical protein
LQCLVDGFAREQRGEMEEMVGIRSASERRPFGVWEEREEGRDHGNVTSGRGGAVTGR